MEPNILAEFKKCPSCGCTETVAQLATKGLKDEGKIQKDAFTSLQKELTPLLQPQLVMAVPVVLCHYDVCAECGTKYCTRAEAATMMAGPAMQNPQGKGFPPGQIPPGPHRGG